MKKALLVIGLVLLVGCSLISCKRECFCDYHRLETGNVISNYDIGPATKQQCANLNKIDTIQIFTGTFHDSVVCHF
ncbi:MAG: hypothetical protein MJZ46_08225 [Bacteroidales bacterium]|nr:hypothetical protein [Bacteroidales bacterium]